MAADRAANEKFCFECGSAIRINAEICPKCGVRQPPPPGVAYVSASPVLPQDPAEVAVLRIASLQRVSAIVWLVIGILQVLFVVTIIAGVWNVIAAILMFKRIDRIKARDLRIPGEFQPILGLVAICIVNLVFGAVFGALWVLYDFYLRGEVLRHKHLFEGVLLPSDIPRLDGWVVRTSSGEYQAQSASMVEDWLREGRINANDFVYSSALRRWAIAKKVSELSIEAEPNST